MSKTKFYKTAARALSRKIHPEKFTESKVETWIFNDWQYTFQETCKGVRVGITDPRGHFYGYVDAPGRNNSGISPNG